MFIGHLPAGYLLTTSLLKRIKGQPKGILAVGLIASILPDFDLLYFYLIDKKQHPHHSYIFHWPLFWLALGTLSLLFIKLLKLNRYFTHVALATSALILHMLLDSIAADINWLAPIGYFPVEIVKVPSNYDWWVWNFVFHWTFALELAIALWVSVRLWRNNRF